MNGNSGISNSNSFALGGFDDPETRLLVSWFRYAMAVPVSQVSGI